MLAFWFPVVAGFAGLFAGFCLYLWVELRHAQKLYKNLVDKVVEHANESVKRSDELMVLVVGWVNNARKATATEPAEEKPPCINCDEND